MSELILTPGVNLQNVVFKIVTKPKKYFKESEYYSYLYIHLTNILNIQYVEGTLSSPKKNIKMSKGQ